jgi:hypothetical protein
MTMKGRILVSLCLASFVSLAGCKGFWDLPPSSGSGGTTPTTLSSGVFYVLNQTTKQIVGYSISSGKLGTITGGTQTLPLGPYSLAIAPTGGYLYVGVPGAIYLYTIVSGGALQGTSNSQAIYSYQGGQIPAAMVVSGSWLVDAFLLTPGVVELDAIPISSSNGLSAVSQSNPVQSQQFNIANATVKQMVLSPDGDNLFVTLGAGGTIVVPFNLGNSNPLGATATTINVANGNAQAYSVAVDPQDRLFYIGETNANSAGTSGGLLVYDYTSLGTGIPRNAPTQISGSPLSSGGLAPNAILAFQSGLNVYVANGTGNTATGNVAAFSVSVSGTTYTVAAENTIAAGIQPIGLAEDSDGNFVLAVATGGSTSSGNPDLDAYTMSSGALTSAIQSSTGTDPVGAVAIAALP